MRCRVHDLGWVKGVQNQLEVPLNSKTLGFGFGFWFEVSRSGIGAWVAPVVSELLFLLNYPYAAVKRGLPYAVCLLDFQRDHMSSTLKGPMDSEIVSSLLL